MCVCAFPRALYLPSLVSNVAVSLSSCALPHSRTCTIVPCRIWRILTHHVSLRAMPLAPLRCGCATSADESIDSLGSHVWETDQRKIVKHYFRTWFVLDAFTIFVPGSIDVSLAMPSTRADSDEDANGRRISSIRVLRIIRLTKIVRLVRSSRVYRRWQSRISISSSAFTVLQCFGILFISAHWYVQHPNTSLLWWSGAVCTSTPPRCVATPHAPCGARTHALHLRLYMPQVRMHHGHANELARAAVGHMAWAQQVQLLPAAIKRLLELWRFLPVRRAGGYPPICRYAPVA